MSSSSLDDNLVSILSDMRKWIRFEAKQSAKRVIEETLGKDSDKIAYHYSDGRPSRDIAKLAGVSDFAIRSYWKDWASVGIAEPSVRYKGRYERVFSLEEFGIEVPAPKVPPVVASSSAVEDSDSSSLLTLSTATEAETGS